MTPFDVTGGVDMHVHSNPALMQRAGDDLYHARICRDGGLAGFLLKSHHEPTVSRAFMAQQSVPGIRVFGGIVLNWTVGGLNPIAAEAQIATGARQVWMPTIHARAHAEALGLGTYGYQSAGLKSRVEPITVLDGEGALKDSVKIIAELVRDADVVLGTAHLAPEEVHALARHARDIGLRKLLVTHPTFRPPGLTFAQVVELAGMGAWFEFCAGNMFPIPGTEDLDFDLRVVREIGVGRCVLSSDCGQHRKGPPAESIRIFGQCMLEKGVPADEVRRMIVDNPRFLLGWEG